MVELPTVIKVGLTTIWAARGGEFKRQLIHTLYNVTLTRGFSALATEGTMTLKVFNSIEHLSVFVLHLFFLDLFSLSINKPEKNNNI